VPKWPVMPLTSLSKHTTRVSITMSVPATAIPTRSDGAMGRINKYSKRVRVVGEPIPALEAPPVKMRPGVHQRPGRCDGFCLMESDIVLQRTST
jgi:hypothetical protein